jgi:hypothetical protein
MFQMFQMIPDIGISIRHVNCHRESACMYRYYDQAAILVQPRTICRLEHESSNDDLKESTIQLLNSISRDNMIPYGRQAYKLRELT